MTGEGSNGEGSRSGGSDEGSRNGSELERVTARIRELAEPRGQLEALQPGESEQELLERLAGWLEAKSRAGATPGDVIERVVDALAAVRDAALAKVAARLLETESSLQQLQEQGGKDLQETFQKVQGLEQALKNLQQLQGEGGSQEELASKVQEQAELLEEAVSQKKQLEEQLQAEKQARSEGQGQDQASNDQVKSLQQELEKERKEKEDVKAKLNAVGESFHLLEKEREEATKILKEAEEARNELEKERATVSSLRQQLEEAKASESPGKGKQQVGKSDQEGEPAKEEQGAEAIQGLRSQLQAQHKALSEILRRVSSMNSDDDYIKRLQGDSTETKDVQNALADKEDLQKQLKEMEQRTFRADHAEALESRLNEAREEMEVLAKDLAKSFNIDPNGVGASSLRDMVEMLISEREKLGSRFKELQEKAKDMEGRVERAEQERDEALSQLQETEEDTQEEQEENQYFDTVDDMGDGEYVRKENEEGSIAEAYNGYVASLKQRIAELERQLHDERCMDKGQKQVGEESKYNTNGDTSDKPITSQLDDLRQCYDQLRVKFTEQNNDLRWLQNYIVQQQEQAKRWIQNQDAPRSEDSYGTHDTKVDRLSTEVNVESEAASDDVQRSWKRPASAPSSQERQVVRGKKLSSKEPASLAEGNDFDRLDDGRGSQSNRVQFMPKEVKPMTARGTTHVRTRARSQPVKVLVSDEAGPLQAKQSGGKNRRGGKKRDAPLKQHQSGTPRFCKRPACSDRASCEAIIPSSPSLRSKQSKRRKWGAKLYAVRGQGA